MIRPISLIAAVLVGTSALASGPGESHGEGTSYLANAVFTYEVYEASVDHADLENCPSEFDPEKVFCRLTLAAEQAHVFVFSYDGEQPLLAVKHYELGDGFLPF